MEEFESSSVPQWRQAKENLVSVIDDYNYAISKLVALTSDLPRRLCMPTVGCTMGTMGIQGLHPESDGLSRDRTRDRGPNPRVSPRHMARPIVSSAFENGQGQFEADEDVMQPAVSGAQRSYVVVQSQSTTDDLSTDDLYSRSFTMLQEWVLKDTRAIEQHIKAANGSAERDKTFARTVSIENKDGIIEVSSMSKRVVSSPDTHFRVAWELFGILLAMYDMIWVPLILAFSPPEGIRKNIDWVGRIFWSLNVPLTLTTGYVDDGRLITDLRLILKKYLKTWFFVDLFTIPPDWLFLFMDSGGASADYVKILRSLRTLRLFRLARLVKLRNAWTFIFDSIDSEQVGIFLEVVKMVLVLMLVNHYNACLWCLMGKTSSRNNWIEASGYESPDSVEWPVQYVVAYHWSITQFTPSSMHVQPENAGERCFAIVVVIFGLVGFSYLVGSITSSLGRLRAISELKTTSFWHLRKFMRRYGVPYQLSTRIKSYVENRWADSHNNMRLANMEFLDMLSENLKGELALELHGRALCIHPLMDHLSLACAGTLQRVAIHGVGQLCLAPQDVMFHAGEEATHMSLVASGSMHYTRVHQEQSYPEPVNSHEDWITEPALWVASWRHLGDLRATETTELLNVSSEKLAESASMNPLALWTVHHYAHRYTSWLNSMDPAHLSDITQGEERSQELYTFVRHYDYSGESGMQSHSHFSKQNSLSTINSNKKSLHGSRDKGDTSATGSVAGSQDKGNSSAQVSVPRHDIGENSVKGSAFGNQEQVESQAKNRKLLGIDHVNVLTSDNISLEFDESTKIHPI